MRGFWRKHHGGIGIALAFFLLGAILFLTVRIQNITVTGSDRYTADELEELLFSEPWGRNSAAAYLKDRLKPHRQIPFVEDYRLVFHGPFHVEVIVYEKSVVGYVSCMSSYMYFDRDGIVVENSTEKLEGIPEITGLSFGHIVLNRRLPIDDDEIFAVIMNITQQLSTYGIESDEIHFDSSGVTIRISGAPIDVKLGSEDEIDAKLLALSDMLPQILERGLEGTLDLSSYSETEDSNEVSFRIREENKEPEESEAEKAEETETTEDIQKETEQSLQ